MFIAIAACAAFATPLHAQGNCNPPDTARYLVTFDAVWSAQTHPLDFPPGPHFSGLIGGTHNSAATFWEEGALASPGIEQMAETGGTTLLAQEVQAQINLGSADQVVAGGGIGRSPGSVSITVDMSPAYSEITLVSMVAPSPDWFVGVSGLDLRAGGQWADEVVVSLAPYDAGTDSGTTYTSPNSNTNPPDPIAEILGYPFQGVPLGTFTFRRVPEGCLQLCVGNLVAGQNATVTVTGGTPFETFALLWSTDYGSFTNSSGSWCVEFGIDLPANPTDNLVLLGQFDGNGEFTGTQFVPGSLGGMGIKLQAAERNTCPAVCMSNILVDTIQ